MKKRTLFLYKFVIIILFTGLFEACSVDNSYDLSKDIDLTMALGSDGLALKLGNTEKMYLKDIITTDDSDMLDTITAGANNGLYYLHKEGSSSFDIEVDSIPSVDVEHANITTKVIDGPGVINIPNSGVSYSISTDSTLSFEAKDVPDDIEEIHTINFKNTVYATVTLSTNNSHFKLASYSDLKIKFPDFIKSTSFVNQIYNVPNGNSLALSVPIQSLELPVTGSFGQVVEKNTISETGTIFISGNVDFYTDESINLSSNDSLTINFDLSFTPFYLDIITGLFNPFITPSINPINISDDLPGFLQGEDVDLAISNPTVKIIVEGSNLPVPLLFNGVINSVKNNQTIASVSIPETGSVNIANNATSGFYFSQTGVPFDPVGVNESADNKIVHNLSSLVETIPDEIQIDLSDNKVTTDKSTEHSIQLGKTFNSNINYEVLIPMQFDNGLSIVYNDSIVDLNKDLQDYQADGVTITATAINAVPLDLQLHVIPCDVNGNEINDISVETITIAAGSLEDPTNADVSVKFTPRSPSDISKIDKLLFKVSAAATDVASGDALMSSQYIQLTNVRLKLNGQIITNFN